LCPGAHAGAACFFFINFLCALDSTRAPPVRFFLFFLCPGAHRAPPWCVCVCVCVCVCIETNYAENTFYGEQDL
jgi:hypothetical protein